MVRSSTGSLNILQAKLVVNVRQNNQNYQLFAPISAEESKALTKILINDALYGK
jgi:hypothetical protein